LSLIAFPISCVHQFYFVRTEEFLGHLEVQSPLIATIFGVGGGPMTIGQIAEIFVLAAIPFLAKRTSRKTLLAIGLLAYILRFAVFAYLPQPAAVYPALALHGICFGCFFFVCFMIVDEETTADVRASAQGFFALIIFGFGPIVGNYAAGQVDRLALDEAGRIDYAILFSTPMWVVVACLVAHLLFYPGRRRPGSGSVS
ncbi:MAG: MFS transporter, partial [Planctomycetota bacterium]